MRGQYRELLSIKYRLIHTNLLSLRLLGHRYANLSRTTVLSFITVLIDIVNMTRRGKPIVNHGQGQIALRTVSTECDPGIQTVGSMEYKSHFNAITPRIGGHSTTDHGKIELFTDSLAAPVTTAVNAN